MQVKTKIMYIRLIKKVLNMTKLNVGKEFSWIHSERIICMTSLESDMATSDNF